MHKGNRKHAIRQPTDRNRPPRTQAQDRQVFDSFSNPFARLGFGQPNLMEASEYPITRITQDYAKLQSMYRNDWIASRVIDTIPEDMTKNWYSIVSQIQPDQIKAYETTERRTHLKQRILEGLKWGRLFGGAAGVIAIDGQEDMLDQPLDLRLVMPGSFKGLIVADRWSGIYPDGRLVTDINDPDYGLPEYYTFALSDTGRGSGVRVHHSRVVRFTGRELPYIERMSENYWGMSEIEHIFTELNKRNTSSENIAQLIFQANIRTYKMADLGQMLMTADARTQRELYATLAMQNFLQSNMGMNVMDKEDDLQTTQYAFTGVSDVYEMFMLDIAGAAEIPVTKLFGRSPAGMNATGESDLTNYYDKIRQEQEAFLRPVIEKLMPVIALSTWGAIPDDIDFEFNPVGNTTEQERASLIQQSSAAIVSVFQSGIISQQTALRELKQSGAQYGMWNAITDADIDNADDGTGAMFDELGMPGPYEPEEPKEPDEPEEDGPTADTADTLDYPGQKRKNGQFAEGKMPGGGKQSGSGKKGQNSEPSATGANKLQRGFTPSQRKEHETHRKEQYPDLSPKQYEQRGIDLCQQPVGGDIDGFLDSDGNIVRYRKSTNEFAKGHPQRGLMTLYKPKSSAENGYQYFLKQKEKARKSIAKGKTR
ncbi:MAG: DUF1073 domain-containing protein [Clostridia bacterium]|nr:DUF1073 domain-containing protein [Clostridia bacterium]